MISRMLCSFNLAQLCDLYENDSIFDKFECCLSGDGQRVATGSYRSALYLHDPFFVIFIIKLSLFLDVICHHL